MKLGLIGCGRMGKALAVGAIDAGAVKASDLIAYDVVPAAVEGLVNDRGTSAAASVGEVIANADVLLLATKPWDVSGVLQEIAASGTPPDSLLVISVAAGITLETMERECSGHARIIRSMPNTPALVGQGAAAFVRGSSATDADAETARQLLGSVGLSVEVKESLMDAVTGLSGSGPAYVYLFIEALADGGVKNGLPREHALQLAAQTVLGAAAMVQSTGEHPGALKDMVASPGGTTIAGLAVLESRAVRGSIIDAVGAATEKSKELSKA